MPDMDEEFNYAPKRGSGKHKQRLALLNMQHCSKHIDATASPDRRSGKLKNLHVRIAGRKKHRSSGGIVVASTIARANFPQTEKDSDVVQPKRPRRSIRMQLLDSSALVRCDLTNAREFHKLKAKVSAMLAFLHEITALSQDFDVLEGTLFQEFLSSKYDKQRLQKVYPMSSETAQYCITQSQHLIHLLRVKIEDDNDLKLARTALNEIGSMLQDIRNVSRARNVEEFDLVKNCLS